MSINHICKTNEVKITGNSGRLFLEESRNEPAPTNTTMKMTHRRRIQIIDKIRWTAFQISNPGNDEYNIVF